MIGAEEQASYRVRVDMSLKPHGSAPLDVEDDAIPIVIGWLDALVCRLRRQVAEGTPVKLAEPWQPRSHLISVDAAAEDRLDVQCLSCYPRGPREISEIRVCGNGSNILLPMIRKVIIDIESGPVEWSRHRCLSGAENLHV